MLTIIIMLNLMLFLQLPQFLLPSPVRLLCHLCDNDDIDDDDDDGGDDNDDDDDADGGDDDDYDR